MVNAEVQRLVDKSLQTPLTDDDLKRLESLLKMRQLLQDKPSIVYVKDFDEVYDRTILSTLNQEKLPPSKKKGYVKKKDKAESKSKI